MDSNAQMRLVFAGEVLPGFQADEVRRRFGEKFKLEGARLAAMFSGERTVLKRSLSYDDAVNYIAQLQKYGVRVHMEPADAPPAASPVAAAAKTVVAPPVAAPLALVATAEEITCPNCGERQPKRAFCRSCTTDIERALASKAEDAERARAERLDAARTAAGGRWAAPRAAIGEERTSGGLADPPPIWSLNFEGRMGRVSYINALAVTWVALVAIAVVAAILIPLTRSMLLVVPFGLGGLLFLVWSLRVMALRLHDFNRSGWWGVLAFVPYLGILGSLVLLFIPGSAEDNDYGEKPRQGNGLIAAIVVVVWFVSLSTMAVVAQKSYKQYSERARALEREGAERAEPQGAAMSPRSAAAQEAYRAYLNEPDSKAFAVSGDAWGWHAGDSSPEDAAAKALTACDQRRAAYTSQCRVVSVNGAWLQQR